MFSKGFRNFQLKKDNQDLKGKKKKQDEDPRDPTPPPVPPHKTPEEVKVIELTAKVEAMETEMRRSAEVMSKRSAEVEVVKRDLEVVRAEYERLRSNQEVIVKEKWELATANNDLKSRLQQSLQLRPVLSSLV